jgi:hypothetical protein
MFSNLRSLIFKLDPETAHNLAIKSLKLNFIPNVLIKIIMKRYLKLKYLINQLITLLVWPQVLIKMQKYTINYLS